LFCLFVLLFSCGRSQADYRAESAAQFSAAKAASWEGAGFSSAGPAGVEGQTPPAYRDMSNLYEQDREPEAPPSQYSGAQAAENRKLVKKANLRIRAENPELTEGPVNELMEKYGAWPAMVSFQENSRNYSIRVPSPHYEVMLGELEGLGKLLRRTENAEDVTLRYYDLESRLVTKRELLRTYQSYLGRAKNIEEIMTVERHIADLQREIDSTGTQFRNLSNQIDYSTIDLEIIGPAGISSYSEPTLKEKLGELFGSFGDTASSALVIIMGIIIYGVPLVLILIFMFWILFGRIGLLRKLMRLAMGRNKSSE
jgi:hypothetical protein